MSGTQAVVRVEVCTGWTAPDAPGELDGPAIADVPDIAGWLDALDEIGPQARLALHGRTLTQLVVGEPVELIEEMGDWVRVVALWQPSEADPRGYPTWVRRAHLADRPGDSLVPPAGEVPADRLAIARAARRHLGLTYLWGGTTPYGLDCSGLVHHTYRQAGVVVPRDAHDQWRAAAPVPLGEEQPGDLYFFARPDGFVFHVGFVTGERAMLHAPETGQHIEDAPLTESRLATLFAAGRFLS
jgi:gamma-D-glutamyl-L-lysine dipeptidyl-peptidase